MRLSAQAGRRGGFGAALQSRCKRRVIARGAHLAAMKAQGLQFGADRGDIHLVPTRATMIPLNSARSISCCFA